MLLDQFHVKERGSHAESGGASRDKLRGSIQVDAPSWKEFHLWKGRAQRSKVTGTPQRRTGEQLGHVRACFPCGDDFRWRQDPGHDRFVQSMHSLDRFDVE